MKSKKVNSMSSRVRHSLPLLFAVLTLNPGISSAAQVESIEFSNTDRAQEIIIRADSPIEFDSQKNADDRQFILTLKNSRFSKKADRKMDTSNFDGPVTLVNPTNPAEESGSATLVIQLREDLEPLVVSEAGLIRVTVGRTSNTSASTTGPNSDSMGGESQRSEKPQAEKGLELFAETQVSKRFSGRPITLRLRDTPLTDVLSMIAEASGFNIILGDGIEGKVTLSLVDVPWDQALDVILTVKRLGAERRNNVLRIVTLANLTAEKEEQLRAKQASERVAVKITRVFPVNYANIADLRSTLAGFIGMTSEGVTQNGGNALGSMQMGSTQTGSTQTGSTQMGSQGTSGVSDFASGNIQMDLRTNTIIIRDTAENLEKYKSLIEILDVETPQVLIEGKVVEATEDFNKVLNGQLGFSRVNGDGRGVAGTFNGSGAFTGLSGSTVSSTSGAGTIGYSPSIAFLPPVIDRLNLLISMQEEEETVRVISAPKMVVMNRSQARIVKSTPTVINQSTVVGGGIQNTQTVVPANLSLDATPTVTNSGSVLLDIRINRDAVINNFVAQRNIETQVLVDSGSTLVIGGIFTSDDSQRKSGFPILKDIPLVGWLFGSSTNISSRSELVIFVTPRILGGNAPKPVARPEGETAAPKDQG